MTGLQDSPVPCPLCEYDLRGLPEPRCPECGAVYSSWEELTDPARRVHPYLFEHHRRIGTFLRTLLNGWRPWRFWTSLHPAQPINRRRLLLYWLIACAFLLLPFASLLTHDVLVARSRSLALRSQLRLSLVTTIQSLPALRQSDPRAARQIDADLNQYIQKYGTETAAIDGVLDEEHPLPPSRAFFRQFRDDYAPFSRHLTHTSQGALLIMSVTLALTPFALLTIMMIFRASMRRSGVRNDHMLRVATYSSDVLIWPAMLSSIVAFRAIGNVLIARSFTFAQNAIDMILSVYVVGIMLSLIFITLRLSAAMGRYLQFRHPPAMAFSVVVILVLCGILLSIIVGQL